MCFMRIFYEIVVFIVPKIKLKDKIFVNKL